VKTPLLSFEENMRVYNIRNRKTGSLVRKQHFWALGHAKRFITDHIDRNNNYKSMWDGAEYDLVAYEMVEVQSMPITGNNDFNKLMYHTLEMEKKKK